MGLELWWSQQWLCCGTQGPRWSRHAEVSGCSLQVRQVRPEVLPPQACSAMLLTLALIVMTFCTHRGAKQGTQSVVLLSPTSPTALGAAAAAREAALDGGEALACVSLYMVSWP